MDRRALSNFVVVSVFIVLVIAGAGILSFFVFPVLNFGGEFGTFENTLSPENFSVINNTNNITENVISENCIINKAYWFNESGIIEQGLEGGLSGIAVEGSGCEGSKIKFRVFEEDFSSSDDSANIDPSESTFVNGRAESNWINEWSEDCNGLCNPPEYYFEGFIGDDKIKSNLIEIGKSIQDFSPLESCKALSSINTDGIDIVIFADNKTAEEYADYFVSFSPIKQNKNLFNFYYIEDYKPDCEIYKDIALLCRSKDMIKRASSCPNDYIMVVEEHDSRVRSSAFMNIMSINSNLPSSVVQHEFGHVFASLAEEYAPAILLKEAKNCVNSCDKFNINDGCFMECSRGDYYRSIENGVMRTLSSNDFGKFNNNIIIERLRDSTTIPITGNAIQENVACGRQRYYLLEGYYDYEIDDVHFTRATIETGCADYDSNGYGDVEVEVTEAGITSDIEFNPLHIYTDGIGEEGIEGDIDGETYLNVDPFYLKIPIRIDKSPNEPEDESEYIAVASLTSEVLLSSNPDCQELPNGQIMCAV